MVDESNISECEMIDPAMNHIKESVCKKNQNQAAAPYKVLFFFSLLTTQSPYEIHYNRFNDFTWIQQIGQEAVQELAPNTIEEIRITEQIESEYGNKSVQHSPNVYSRRKPRGWIVFNADSRERFIAEARA
ncbi:hypothetical protein C5167_021573 [Papaver somniferum]|nr:hypothetical protein C5167_021573 [Papaver somniferum]